jgi:hypothetical protein
MWLSKAARSNGVGGSNPSQAVRLLWFFLFFLSPMAAVVYVSQLEPWLGSADPGSLDMSSVTGGDTLLRRGVETLPGVAA